MATENATGSAKADTFQKGREVMQVSILGPGKIPPPLKKENALGMRLARVRAQAQLRQDDFAREHGVSISAYKNYERGATPIPVALIQKVAATYEINAEWLLFGDEGRDVYANTSKKGALK